jgi:hypothetical protein
MNDMWCILSGNGIIYGATLKSRECGDGRLWWLGGSDSMVQVALFKTKNAALKFAKRVRKEMRGKQYATWVKVVPCMLMGRAHG